jgi:signal transduction histidine kinase
MNVRCLAQAREAPNSACQLSRRGLRPVRVIYALTRARIRRKPARCRPKRERVVPAAPTPGTSFILRVVERVVKEDQQGREATADAREATADAREADADARELTADAREVDADSREVDADSREVDADSREVIADSREATADEHDVAAQEHSRLADLRLAEANVHLQTAKEHLNAATARAAQADHRQEDAERLMSFADEQLVIAAEKLAEATSDSEEYQRALYHYTQLVRHRMANPLHIIGGMAATLRAKPDLPSDERLTMLEAIHAQVKILERICLDPKIMHPSERELDPSPVARNRPPG